MVFDPTDFKGVQVWLVYYGLWKMVSLCYCERDMKLFRV